MSLRTQLIRFASALTGPDRRAVLQVVADCQKQFSMGWIDPSGKLLEMPGTMSHDQWAAKWLGEQGLSGARNPTGEENSKVLMSKGWVKASSFRIFEIGMSPSQRALRGAARACTDCLLAKRLNPENTDVQIWNQLGRTTRMDALRFIERYGGASMAGELFRLLK